MLLCAGVLGLSPADKIRWLWSYYSSRMPVALRGSALTFVTVRQGTYAPVPIAIQNNGFDWHTVTEVFMKNIYQVELTGVRRILDLGGNIGIAGLFFHRLFPDAEICTVEPIPGNLSVLRRNMQLDRGVVHVVPAAAGAQNGKTVFELSHDPRSHSSVGSKGIPNPTMFEAKVLSVPTILEMCGWDEIDLVKMDIEGGEIEVLRDCPPWLNKVRLLIGEGHEGSGYTMDLCRKDLEPMGFHVELLEQSEGSFLFAAKH